MSADLTLTAGNFDTEVLKSTVPVLVDFWAGWCMPCKMIAPFIEEIAAAYQGKLKVGKVNVDQESELAARYGIVSIPSLLIFKDGKLMRQQSGALPRKDIEDLLTPYL